jgi:Xaa-Pro aminopeptidase
MTTAEDQNPAARVLALIKNPNEVRVKQKFVAASGYAHVKILPWE